MRSSLALASALAIGALASPYEKRKLVTEYDIDVVTVTVYVTEGQAEPTAPAYPTASSSAKPSSSAAPSSSSATAYSSSSIVVASSSAAPSSSVAYTPAPSSTAAQSSTEAASSSQVASSSAAPTSSAAATTSAPSDDHPTGTIEATLSTGADYQAAVLYHHNEARANHNADALTWCDDCEANAKVVAENCTFAHYLPDGVDEGQNLFTVSGDYFNVTAGITESWYKGEFQAMLPYFGQDNVPDDVFEQVGHLTQMLWKATTSVGCYSADCTGRMTVGDDTNSDLNKYTVCNYAPAGNYENEYGTNVGSPISTTNLGSWTD